MSGLSNYFHPDDVMLALAGLISDGLKYHAAAMQLVSADDQIDDLSYEEAIEEAEQGYEEPKIVIAKLFAENRKGMFVMGEAVASSTTTREFYKPKLTLNVTFNRMRRRFRKEIARITTVPVLKPSANSNIVLGEKTITGDAPILQGDHSKPPTVGNVASMADWRDILRKSA